MTHDDLRDLVAAYALSTATQAERAAFEAHLEGCAECRAEVESLRPVVQGLAFTAPLHEPSLALRGRVLKAVSSESVTAPLVASGADSWFGWRTAAGLAALLVIGVGVYTVSLQIRMAALRIEFQEAAAVVARIEEEVADLRRTADERQAALRVLGATDLARIESASRASGTWRSGPSLLEPFYRTRLHGIGSTGSARGQGVPVLGAHIRQPDQRWIDPPGRTRLGGHGHSDAAGSADAGGDGGHARAGWWCSRADR